MIAFKVLAMERVMLEKILTTKLELYKVVILMMMITLLIKYYIKNR